MKKEVIDLIINELINRKSAYLDYSKREMPALTQRIVLDLSVARLETDPYIVNYAFKSVFLETATDTSCKINLKAISKDDSQKAFKMQLRDSWSQDFQVPKCFLHWSAQPGKSVELVFFSDSEFRSGSQISVTSGGVSITEGTSFTTSVASLLATTATSILPINSNRSVASIQNNTGGAIYLGNSLVSNTGANLGYLVEPGATFQWKNTAQLYCYALVAGDLLILEESL